MKTYNSIYDFVIAQETAMTQSIEIETGYEWSFKTHVQETILYTNSQLIAGKNKGSINEKPVKNIIRPITNLQKRIEGFDLKDIELFVDDAKNYYKSFLIKKYHTKWARENGIDTFIDEMAESYVDFGGALIKKVNNARPEVVPMQSIAFCDQTNMLSGPLGIKHYYSPSELKEMEKFGWGKETNGATITINELITLSEDHKQEDKMRGKQNKTPGQYIELYEIYGSLPDNFLDDSEYTDEYSLQMHIVGFYIDSTNQKQGICLFKKQLTELPLKLILRDKIYGRALGMGGAEELFEPQVWVNYGAIRIKEMLDAAAKIVYKTTDPNIANRNKMDDVENGEFLELAPNTDVTQLDTSPRTLPAFDRYIQEWEAHAQKMGAATDPLLGESPSAGTPFRLQERVVLEGKGLHEYRRGKLATFVDEIYREWIIPYIAKEISKGQEFLAELDVDELTEVADSIMRNRVNVFIKEKILNGELIDPMEVETFKERVREEFMRGGNKRFIKILERELKGAPMSVRISIAGKQENLAGRTDKLVNIFRQIIAAPQILQNPAFGKLFNQIISASGLDPIDFTSLTKPIQSQQIPQRPPEIALAQ